MPIAPDLRRLPAPKRVMRRRLGWLLLLAMSVVAGTLWAQERTVRPARPRPTAAAPTSFLGVKIPVRTAKGRRFVTAVVRDGIALYQGDIELGDPADTTERALGVADEDLRWPDGVVPYFLSSPVRDNAVESTLRAAMAHVEQRTPIRFVEQTTPVADCSPGALIFAFSSIPDVSSSKVGFQGGCQHLRVWPGHGQGVVIHELGHALGLPHEQSRADRDAWVQVLWQNIKEESKANFAIVDDVDGLEDLTPYDYDSVMHYGNDNFCVRNPVSGECVGPTLLARSDTDPGPPNQQFGGGALSTHDVNMLSLMYAKPLGKNESGDRLGTAVVLGDFDDDGFSDLVMGAPGERVRSGPRSGALFVLKGTSAEPVPWAVLTEETPRPDGSTAAGNEDDDQLGTALLAADFDQDGITDLAAGAPNKAPGGGPRSGGVMLYRGTPTGLVGWWFLNLSDLGVTGAAGDRFGASLAVLKLTNSGAPLLVVGAPGRGSDGAVYVVQMGLVPAGNRPSAELLPDDSPGEAQFGAALDVADFNGDGRVDLAVGAPWWGAERAGSVHVFMGNGTRALTRLQNVKAPAGANGDEFGFAVLSMNVVAGDGMPELVIGAPGKRQGSVKTGAAFVYALRPGGLLASFAEIDHVFPGAITEQRFGHALATGRLTGNASLELVVGAPWFDGGAGRVVILTPREGKLVRVRDITPSAFMPQPRFGAAIAAGTMNVWPGSVPPGEATEPPKLFAGAPNAALGPGGATGGLVYAYNTAASQSFLRARFDQERSTPWSAD